MGCKSRGEIMTCVTVRLERGCFFNSQDALIVMVRVLG